MLLADELLDGSSHALVVLCITYPLFYPVCIAICNHEHLRNEDTCSHFYGLVYDIIVSFFLQSMTPYKHYLSATTSLNISFFIIYSLLMLRFLAFTFNNIIVVLCTFIQSTSSLELPTGDYLTVGSLRYLAATTLIFPFSTLGSVVFNGSFECPP